VISNFGRMQADGAPDLPGFRIAESPGSLYSVKQARKEAVQLVVGSGAELLTASFEWRSSRVHAISCFRVEKARAKIHSCRRRAASQAA